MSEETTIDIAGLRANLVADMDEIGGCGDSGCIVHVGRGLVTNGGCRCGDVRVRRAIGKLKAFNAALLDAHEAQAERIAALDGVVDEIWHEVESGKEPSKIGDCASTAIRILKGLNE